MSRGAGFGDGLRERSSPTQASTRGCRRRRDCEPPRSAPPPPLTPSPRPRPPPAATVKGLPKQAQGGFDPFGVGEESNCRVCTLNRLTFEPPSLYCFGCAQRVKRNQVGEVACAGSSRLCAMRNGTACAHCRAPLQLTTKVAAVLSLQATAPLRTCDCVPVSPQVLTSVQPRETCRHRFQNLCSFARPSPPPPPPHTHTHTRCTMAHRRLTRSRVCGATPATRCTGGCGVPPGPGCRRRGGAKAWRGAAGATHTAVPGCHMSPCLID